MSPAAAALAEQVAEILEPVFRRLERIAHAAVASRAQAGGIWRESDLGGVQKLILELIADDELLVGLGFVAASEQVEGKDRYMLWFQRTGGQATRLFLNFDRSSIDVYDYVEMDWFRLPTVAHPRGTFGPYVDYSGSGLYVVTASAAAVWEGEIIGVAGGDLQSRELERRLMSVLGDADREVLLINNERRVVATNSPRWIHAARLREMPTVGARLGDATVLDVHDLPLGIGWRLALTDAPGPRRRVRSGD